MTRPATAMLLIVVVLLVGVAAAPILSVGCLAAALIGWTAGALQPPRGAR